MSKETCSSSRHSQLLKSRMAIKLTGKQPQNWWSVSSGRSLKTGAVLSQQTRRPTLSSLKMATSRTFGELFRRGSAINWTETSCISDGLKSASRKTQSWTTSAAITFVLCRKWCQSRNSNAQLSSFAFSTMLPIRRFSKLWRFCMDSEQE